jgi:hypothetical protein
MEDSMRTALARLRAKTDHELGVLVARHLQRSRRLACQGEYHDAAKDYAKASALLTVAEIPLAERVRLERLLREVRATIELPAAAMA